MNLKIYTHKFQKIGYSGILPFVYVGKEEINKSMQYKVSVTVHMGRITNQSIKMAAIKSESLNI